jgi:hypothetical protein
MGDWLLNLPIPWMALVVFSAIYLLAAAIYLTVIRLAVDGRARAFKALSPGMLPPLGIIFGLLVGFVAVQVWNDFDHAKTAVTNEASALRAIVLLAEHLPDEQKSRLRALVNSHIEEAVQQEWPAMAEQRATLETLPQALVQCLDVTLNMKPADESQATVQREIVDFLGKAADCSYGCPCQFNGLPTHGHCRAVAGIKIEQGHHGPTKLDGQNFMAMFRWPGAIHEGKGEGAVVVDERATETQRQALLRIITGQDTEPGATIFNVFASTLEKLHDSIFAPIDFQVDVEGRKARDWSSLA